MVFCLCFSAEADELSGLIDGAREQLKNITTRKVEPYDMSVLLDENLEKEKLYNEMKRKIFDPMTMSESPTRNEGWLVFKLRIKQS